MKQTLILLTLFLLTFDTATAVAQSTWKTNKLISGLDHTFVPSEHYQDESERELYKIKLINSIMNMMKFCKQRLSNQVVLLKSCRSAHGGCLNRIEHISEYILRAAEKYEINPWLLSAVAYNESRFNPFAVDPAVGGTGIFQLNPKTKRGKRSKFVQNLKYRNKCRNVVGNCQEKIVNFGADHLASAIKKCGGLQEGLSMYNTGRCDVRRKYVYNTARAWKQLISYSGLEEIDKNVPWCSSSSKKKKRKTKR